VALGNPVGAEWEVFRLDAGQKFTARELELR
jgi:hypothetical protein